MRTAAIIAGGRAQRLGGLDKSNLVIGGRRIIDRQLSVLGHVAEHILIVSNDHYAFRASGLQVCADLIQGAGPLSGLYTALVRSPTAQTIVVACDLPFLTVSFLRHLAARARGADAVDLVVLVINLVFGGHDTSRAGRAVQTRQFPGPPRAQSRSAPCTTAPVSSRSAPDSSAASSGYQHSATRYG